MQLKARRINTSMSAVIDRGIQFQQLFGTKFAAEYLSFHHVGIDVTVRVLTRPHERRNPKPDRSFPYMNNQDSSSFVV